MTCGRKCFRKGRITSNGYLNFLRMYRQKCCGLSPTETVRRGAKAWNRLNCEQKKRYKRMGSCKKRRKQKKRRCSRPRKRKCATKRRRKSSCKKQRRRPKRRSGCKRRKKCMRAGPVTSNGYLNFLRWFRKKHCGLKPTEAVRKGARKWCSMPESEKERFRRMACKVAKGKKSKRSAVCRRC